MVALIPFVRFLLLIFLVRSLSFSLFFCALLFNIFVLYWVSSSPTIPSALSFCCFHFLFSSVFLYSFSLITQSYSLPLPVVLFFYIHVVLIVCHVFCYVMRLMLFHLCNHVCCLFTLGHVFARLLVLFILYLSVDCLLTCF